MNHLLFFVLTIMLLSSCVVEEADLSRYTDESVDNVEEARDIEVRYTDSSFLVLILKAPVSRRKVDRYAMVLSLIHISSPRD